MALPSKSAPAADAAPREGKLRWFIGWVLVPGALLGALFLSGVHVGARNPEIWIARMLSWIFG